MRTVFRALALMLVLVLAGLLTALAAALQREPSVALRAEPDHADVARALELLRRHDPRRLPPGAIGVIGVGERDLEVLLNHGAQRWLARTSTQIGLQRGAAVVRSSVHLPANPFGRWLNLQARVAETGALPVIDSLQVGALPLPAWLGEWAGLRLVERAGLREELRVAADMVQRVRFAPQQLSLVYAWAPQSVQRVANALVPPADQERMRVYTAALAAQTARVAPGWTVSLAPLLGPLFTLAQQRSAAPDADAAAENRALISVLTLYANGRRLDRLVPAARGWAQPRPLRVTLAERDDTPLHWLVSAALAAESTSPLAKAIGVYKEVADARGGSGFSFHDLAADRAGTRFGELAVQRPQQLQAAVARGVKEADIMPPAADLPENMPEAEFRRRFGGVGEPAYRAMLAEIERRVDALPILR